MRVGILVVGGALLLATATASRAGDVNCKQVNKYLQTGRSVKDVAETMVVGEDDVQKCKDQAAEAAAAKGGDAKAGEKGAEAGK